MAAKKAAYKYELPTPTFPYRVSRRLDLMSRPRRQAEDMEQYMPERTAGGTRKSALRGRIRSERLNDCALPYLRRLLYIKRVYKNMFTAERLARIDRMIEACNATIYAKLANCVIDFRRIPTAKKKVWSDSEWVKHLSHIVQMAKPTRPFTPPPVDRGQKIPLEELMPRIEILATPPDCKIYKRTSQEEWYKDPYKVSPKALKHVASEREKILAKPRPIPPQD